MPCANTDAKLKSLQSRLIALLPGLSYPGWESDFALLSNQDSLDTFAEKLSRIEKKMFIAQTSNHTLECSIESRSSQK